MCSFAWVLCILLVFEGGVYHMKYTPAVRITHRSNNPQRLLWLIGLLLLIGCTLSYFLSRPHVHALPAESTKPKLSGLMDRKDIPQPAYQNYNTQALVRNFVIETDWKTIEPREGQFDFSSIQSKIDRAAAQHMQVRLSVAAGRLAPDWVKSRVGSIPWREPEDTQKGTYQLPLFWTGSYQQLYKNMLSALSERYDGVSNVSEITLAMCTTTYSEPLIRQARAAENKVRAGQAGYTYRADYDCQKHNIDLFDTRSDSSSAAHLFANTRVHFALNPFQGFSPPRGRGGIDDTIQLMRYCRQTLGPRCVLSNHSIRWPLLGGNYKTLYENMKKAGPPLSFQTAVPAKIGDWQKTLQWAIDQKAVSIELNSGYDVYDQATLANFAGQLQHNARYTYTYDTGTAW